MSIPARRYDLAGDVLAEAVDRSVREGVPVQDAVRSAACAHGRHLGAAAAASAAAPGVSEQLRTVQVLAAAATSPGSSASEVVLANCPFDRLARNHTELVCGLNLALVEGVLQGLGCTTLQAALDPRPGRCCVTARVRV